MQMNYGGNVTKDDRELCPVCLEQGEEVAMVRGRPTGYYWLCRCPRCGNLRLVERGEE
jgi:hypothetical protein